MDEHHIANRTEWMNEGSRIKIIKKSQFCGKKQITSQANQENLTEINTDIVCVDGPQRYRWQYEYSKVPSTVRVCQWFWCKVSRNAMYHHNILLVYRYRQNIDWTVHRYSSGQVGVGEHAPSWWEIGGHLEPANLVSLRGPFQYKDAVLPA